MTDAPSPFIERLPKAELHVHVEGTLEPELSLEIAERNGLEPPYSSVDAARAAYRFRSLTDFLDVYYRCAAVLREEEDFYDLALAYLEKAHAQNVLYAEIFFDPQTHTTRGVPFATIVDGIHQALVDAQRKLGIGTKLILCFLRDLDVESAEETLDEALAYKDCIVAVGLDSSEIGNPPSKFRKVFERARSEGFSTVAHAGEEGPAAYVSEALDALGACRIDHGIRSLDDDALVKRLREEQVPLTVCPLSNLRLAVVDNLESHPLKRMLESGLLVTINSDDPAYFGGYINENYAAAQHALGLTDEQLAEIARNSFRASFLSAEEKDAFLRKVDEHAARPRG